MTHEELVTLLQDGKIDHLQFLMNGDHSQEYLAWCREHGVSPDPENAEFFCDMTGSEMMTLQFEEYESDGLWD